MLSRLFDRSVRWLTASLAIAALVTALAVPVQAAPRSESGESEIHVNLVERLAQWLQSLVTGSPPYSSTDSPREPEGIDSINAKGSQSCIDPYGNPVACPEDD